MSNNSYVVEDGEMGRAQVEQAWAAGAKPHVDMNPILLKPLSNTHSQVIVHGKVFQYQSSANDYFNYKNDNNNNEKYNEEKEERENCIKTNERLEGMWRKFVRPSLHKLQSENDVVIIEGAGSCGEVNLWDKDIVNWKVAVEANAKVILVADIDKCGVFAQILGSLSLLPKQYRDLVAGVIINKFRGDPDLFTSGIEYLQSHTDVPILGVLPMEREIHIDSEDGLMPFSVIDPPFFSTPSPQVNNEKNPVNNSTNRKEENNEEKIGDKKKNNNNNYQVYNYDGTSKEKINIGVVLLPHSSNITDYHSLEREPSVLLHYLSKPRNVSNYQMIILPGTKNTLSDLIWLKQSNWLSPIYSLLHSTKENKNKGGMVVGVCGGFQILGRSIKDPDSIEAGDEEEGLGLLNIDTLLQGNKHLHLVDRLSSHFISLNSTFDLSGYEIHSGESFFSPPYPLSSSLSSYSNFNFDNRENIKEFLQYHHNTNPTFPLDLDNFSTFENNNKEEKRMFISGAQSKDGRVWGTYLHGLFDSNLFRHQILKHFNAKAVEKFGFYHPSQSLTSYKEEQYNKLGEMMTKNLNIDLLEHLVFSGDLKP